MMEKYGVENVQAQISAELREVKARIEGYTNSTEDLSKTAASELEELRRRERELAAALREGVSPVASSWW